MDSALNDKLIAVDSDVVRINKGMISVIGLLIAQIGATVWWASDMNAKVEALVNI